MSIRRGTREASGRGPIAGGVVTVAQDAVGAGSLHQAVLIVVGEGLVARGIDMVGSGGPVADGGEPVSAS